MAATDAYLERYLAGEYEQVWAELQALGAAIREEPLYSDALAVARETMRRVRENLEMLIPRLVAIGYQFGYGWVQPPADELFGWRLRRDYLRMLEEVRTQPPILTVDADVEEHLAERRVREARLRDLGAPAILMETQERLLAELEAYPRAAARLRELEERVGDLPLSVRAWYELVGGVNLVGVHPDWAPLIAESGWIDASYWERGFDLEDGGHPMQYLEPLQIFALGVREPYGISVPGGHPVADGRLGRATRSLAIMPNERLAYLENGQDGFYYEIEMPCASADAALLYERHETTFVNYLRICLRWAGFPGWERLPVHPERDIAALTAGLLPF
jgi:hypothetical protein